MVMETNIISNVILFIIWYDHICAYDVYFFTLLFYLCFTSGGCFIMIE
jgi:hypothetical protein